MNLWLFILELVMLLGGAFLLGSLAQRMKQSPILGYILTGTIVGPLLFNTSIVNQTAEIGVSLLLFSIGLEFSFKQLRNLGRLAFGGGIAQIVITILFVTIVILLRVPLPQALTIGAIVALSSTTIVLRLLADRAAIDSVRGRACLGILLLQDIAIVPLVLMVSLLTPAAVNANISLHMLRTIAATAGLIAIFYLLLYRVLPFILSKKSLFANRELTVLLAISVGLGAALTAHTIHISPALGAFIAGMLLGESPFSTQIRSDIGTLRIIMVTLFFTSIGMLAKPIWFFTHLHWIVTASVLIFIVKATIIYFVVRLFGLSNRQSIATGITLSQIGEFSFVLAAAARDGNILDKEVMDLIISVIIVLMLATPYMVAMAFPLADRLLTFLSRKSVISGSHQSSEEITSTNRVMIIGLGPAARHVVHNLKERGLEITAIDVNPQSRNYARKEGIKIHLGDASHEEILTHAGLLEVCMAVVTIPDPIASVRIVQIIRRLRPELYIVARCRYNRHLPDLEKAGADIVIDEENTVGKMLSEKILENLEDDSGLILACRMGGQTPEE